MHLRHCTSPWASRGEYSCTRSAALLVVHSLNVDRCVGKPSAMGEANRRGQDTIQDWEISTSPMS